MDRLPLAGPIDGTRRPAAWQVGHRHRGAERFSPQIAPCAGADGLPLVGDGPYRRHGIQRGVLPLESDDRRADRAHAEILLPARYAGPLEPAVRKTRVHAIPMRAA